MRLAATEAGCKIIKNKIDPMIPKKAFRFSVMSTRPREYKRCETALQRLAALMAITNHPQHPAVSSIAGRGKYSVFWSVIVNY
jgi:hypothetical protein